MKLDIFFLWNKNKRLQQNQVNTVGEMNEKSLLHQNQQVNFQLFGVKFLQVLPFSQQLKK